jgi:PAS domain-containing protein
VAAWRRLPVCLCKRFSVGGGPAQFTPEDVAGLLQKWHAALGSGEPLEAEARVRRADGEYRLLLHRKVPLRNERGAILKWYGSSFDIEGQSETQERIRQGERERLGVLPGEAQRLTRIGTFVQRFTRIGSFDRERFLRDAEEILAKGQAYEHDHRIIRPDGETRVVRVAEHSTRCRLLMPGLQFDGKYLWD